MIETAKEFFIDITIAFKKYTMSIEDFFQKVYLIIEIPKMSVRYLYA